VSDAFVAVHRAVLILMDATALLSAGQDPERAASLQDDLAALLAEL
jgi:hypothetical protein